MGVYLIQDKPDFRPLTILVGMGGALTSTEKKKYKDFLEANKGDAELAMEDFIRWKCVTDLYFLGVEVLGLGKKKRRVSKFHEWLARVLMLSGYKMILVPRGHAKTTWVKVRCIQLILGNPEVRILLLSKSAALVRKELRSIKQMLSNPLLRRYFAHIIPDPGKDFRGWAKCTEDELILKYEDDALGITQEPTIMVAGSATVVTGIHPDYIFLDDFIDKDTCRTAEQMQKAEDNWRYLQPLLDDGGELCITGTFYHYRDLYNVIISEDIIAKDRVFVRKAIEDGKVIYPGVFTKAKLENLRKILGPYIYSCNPGYAPVLMADWTFKRFDEVRVGDKVIGFENWHSGHRNRFVVSTVKEIRSRISNVSKVTFTDGSNLVCTPEHNWYTGRHDLTHSSYLPAKVGRKMTRAVKVRAWGSVTDWQYLAGIIDGEGACKYGSISIHQSHVHNPRVTQKIRETLDTLGLEYDDRKDDKPGSTTFVLSGGRQTKVDLINLANPAKKDQIADNLWAYPGNVISEEINVEAIEPAGEENVFSMETTSGNYVVWGFLSKNCQYELNPLPKEDMIFPGPQPTCMTLPQGHYSWYITIDPAPTTEGYSDQTGFVIAAVDKIRNVYIVEAWGFKKKGEEIANFLIGKCQQYPINRVGIEFGLQANLQYTIDTAVSQYKQRTGKDIPCLSPGAIESIKITKESKGDRIDRTLGAHLRLGKVKILERCKELIMEMDTFTGKGNEKDNIIDATAMLFPLVENFAYRSSFFERIAKNTFYDVFKKKPKNSWRSNFRNAV
jgi:hypothetical protein